METYRWRQCREALAFNRSNLDRLLKAENYLTNVRRRLRSIWLVLFLARDFAFANQKSQPVARVRITVTRSLQAMNPISVGSMVESMTISRMTRRASQDW
jgi:hypothetical protein